MAFDLGDLVPLTVTIKDAAGANTNASTITLTITLPDGTVTSPTVTNPPATTGTYLFDYPTVQPGRHIYRWTSTVPQAAHVDVFDVRPAAPPYLVSLADAKEQLNITTTARDEELRKVVEAATAAVEKHLDMAVIRRTVVEKRNLGNPVPCRDPGVLQRFTVVKKPVISLTSVVSADGGLTWNVADMRAGDAGVVEVLNGAVVWGPVVLTYVAGLQEIPANYTEAAEHIIQHLWQNQRGAQGGPRPGGMDTSGLGFSGLGYAIPNSARELLGDPVGGIA
jgi:hypothetical protein